MAGLLRVACRSSSLLLGLRSGEAAAAAAAAAVSGALETRSGRTSSSTTSSDASGVGGGVSGATGDAVARYTDILGCSISRSSSGDVSTFTGPARVKHAGGVTYHDSSSAVAPSTVEFNIAPDLSLELLTRGYYPYNMQFVNAILSRPLLRNR